MTQNTAPDPAEIFHSAMAEAYDRRNARVRPISACLHFLTDLVLTDIRDDARVLSVGVGTGAEILFFAEAHPGWYFEGVDPSADMLGAAQVKLDEAGLADRCTLHQGRVEDIDESEFDATLALFVAHFVPREERPAF